MQIGPGCAVAVFKHHLHDHAALVGSHQCGGDLRKRELLNSHQQFRPGSIDVFDQVSFKIVAVAPLATEWRAVATVVAMVEANLNRRWPWEFAGRAADHDAGLAAAQQREGQ